MKNKILVLILASFSALVIGQVPKGFKYQAVARNATGSTINNRDVALRVSIVLAPLPGTAVFSEVHHVHTNDFGLFSIEVGNGTAEEGSFAGIDWTSGVYYLRTAMDVNNGTSYVPLGESPLLSVPYALYAENAANGSSQWVQNTNNIYYNNGNVGIGATNPGSKLEVKGALDALPEDPLFEVKDKNGQIVFGVYQDSVRIYLNEGVGKGGRGGFAVGGRGTSKGKANEIMVVTPDSVRIYINDSGLKGGRSGFAVGGRDPVAKGIDKSYFDVSGSASAEIINPSKARIVWYPLKEAFLAGRVLIENPDSIGTNSFSVGFESKPIGDYSQAMGYRCISRGKYSTAFGDSSLAAGNTSFAAGYKAQALLPGTFALGKDVVAKGVGSFAIGINSVTTGESAVAIGMNANSGGLGSIAIGNGTKANVLGSIAVGNTAVSDGFNSIALGFSSEARGNFSSSLGNDARSEGENSTALGYKGLARGDYAAVLGSDAEARGNSSIALGYKSLALGDFSSVLGFLAESKGQYSIALGVNAKANADFSTALGNNAEADSIGSLALGNGSMAKHSNGIAIGTEANSDGISSVAIGNKTNAQGNNATAIGGDGTIASGPYSMAFGFKATSSQEGSVVFGDHSLNASIAVSAGPNQFMARASGGFYFYTNSDMSQKIVALPGAGDWTITSDKNKKENFKDINREDLLEKLSGINIQSWNYKSQSTAIRHAGITAQDFNSNFGFGNSDTTVTHTDLIGVSMVAIQGLIDRTDTLQEKLNKVMVENDRLSSMLKQRDEQMEAMEAKIESFNEMKVEIEQLKQLIGSVAINK